jgi:hypothetical protein
MNSLTENTMKRNGKDFKVKYLITPFIFTIYSSGCSVVGYKMGETADKEKAEYKVVKQNRIESVKHGSDMMLHVGDGSKESGKFMGLTAIMEKENSVSPDDSTIMNSNIGIILQYDVLTSGKCGFNNIKLHTVDLIEVRKTFNAKYVGFVGGLAIDAIVIVLFMANRSGYDIGFKDLF